MNNKENVSSILVKNGHLIDPHLGIDENMDIGIQGDRIADCEKHISSIGYDTVLDASGFHVLPGLVDIHAHVAEHLTPGLGINADARCLANGTTTVVDAGSVGELNFQAFREIIVKPSLTRIFAFLNAESLGMIEFPQYDTGEKWPDLYTAEDERFLDYFTQDNNTIKTVRENPEIIVGLKWAHHGFKSLTRAVNLAHSIPIRIMIENHFMPEPLRQLSPGDIVTHIYHNYNNPNAGRIDGILDSSGSIHEEYYEARRRGIYFDLGHGKGSFSWTVAKKAIENGIQPDSISTDLWLGNFLSPVVDMPTTMAKLLLLGMDLKAVILASTYTPAKIIGKEKSIGSLKTGSLADLLIVRIDEKRIELTDSYGEKRIGKRVISPVKVIHNGSLVSPGPL